MLIVKSTNIAGRRTSVKLQPLELRALEKICQAEGLTVGQFCERADKSPARIEHSRSGRIRMAILNYYMTKADGTGGSLP